MKSVQDSLAGLTVCVALALFAGWLAELEFVKETLRLSALLIVILLGMAIGSAVSLPSLFDAGIKVAQKPVLRWAVAGLGLRLTLQEIGRMGGPSVLLVLFLVVLAGFFSCVWLARWFGVGEKLGLLLATGGSICGASAIVAADSVVEAEGKDAAVSLGIVTFWGTVGIFIFPVVAQALGWKDFAYGLICGSTLHETAQVVAAASGLSPAATEVATVVKLVRICFLAPMVLGMGWWLSRQSGRESSGKKAQLVPWFLVMFCVFSVVVSVVTDAGFQGFVKDVANPAVKFLLAVGMAGVGLQTKVQDLWKAGWGALGLGLVQWLVMIGVAMGAMSILRLW